MEDDGALMRLIGISRRGTHMQRHTYRHQPSSRPQTAMFTTIRSAYTLHIHPPTYIQTYRKTYTRTSLLIANDQVDVLLGVVRRHFLQCELLGSHDLCIKRVPVSVCMRVYVYVCVKIRG